MALKIVDLFPKVLLLGRFSETRFRPPVTAGIQRHRPGFRHDSPFVMFVDGSLMARNKGMTGCLCFCPSPETLTFGVSAKPPAQLSSVP